MTHIVPKSGTTGATLVAYAVPDKYKLVVIGSRGLGAVKQCAKCGLAFLAKDNSLRK